MNYIPTDPALCRNPNSHSDQLFPIQSVLRIMAGQEGCDGPPWDQMIQAAYYIDILERERDDVRCSDSPMQSGARSFQIIADAQRERLNHGLRTLASWCVSRAMLEHDTETTLTMLEKKAAELRGKCMKAGWAAINEYSQHNA
jgi:hypothetical protein